METYTIDSRQSRLAFAVRGLMPTRGTLARIAGTITADTSGVPRSLAVTIPASSLNTRLLPRDLHLKTATFLDARRYPDISYRSERIERTGANRFAVTGLLGFHGNERPVVLEVTVAERAGAFHAHVSGMLSRAAFRVPRNLVLRALMRPMIGDAVAITADVVLMRATDSSDAVASGVSQSPCQGFNS